MNRILKKMGTGITAAAMAFSAAGIQSLPVAAEAVYANIAVVNGIPADAAVKKTYGNVTSYPMFGSLDYLQETTDSKGNCYAVFGSKDEITLVPQDASKAAVVIRNEGFTFGAAVIGDDDRLYVLWGCTYEAGVTDENLVICKYSLTGTLLGSCPIPNSLTETHYPFDAGNANICYKDGVVCALFNQEWNNGHQGSEAAAVNAETMALIILDDWEGSHSFGVSMITTETGFAAVQRGDCYPRGLFCTFYTAKGGSSPSFSSNPENGNISMFHASGSYGEEGSHQNDTHLGMGGIAKSGSTYAFTGRSERFYTSGNYKASGLSTGNYDVFVRLFDADAMNGASSLPFAGEDRIDAETGKIADRYVVWLTECTETEKAGSTKIVTWEDGGFCVLWESFVDGDFDSIRYVLLDEYGNVTREETAIYGARLSQTTIQPIVSGHTLTWAVADIGQVNWVTVDLDDLHDASEIAPANGVEGVLIYTSNFNSVTITGVTDEAAGKIVIPEKINGRTVTAIADGVFSGRSSITEIEIADTVTTIGDKCFFECENLTAVHLPADLRELGGYAFCKCTAIETLTIPDGVTEIGDKSFYYCTSLTELNLPAKLKYIGFAAVYYCPKLETLVLPEGLEKLGSSAISECYALKNVAIPASVQTIADNAFYHDTAFTSVTVPGSVETIGRQAFAECVNLQSAVIGAGVKTIGDRAFSGCGKLTELSVPDSVTRIGVNAFANTPFVKSEDGGVVGTDGWALGIYGSYPTDLVLEDGTIGIADGAFASFTDLTTLLIPQSVKYIGAGILPENTGCTICGYGGSAAESYAAENAIPFVAILDPEKVLQYETADGKVTITGCTMGEGKGVLTIPDTLGGAPVTAIADKAFAGCGGLVSVVLPECVASVGKDAFAECAALERIRIENPDCVISDASTTICNSKDAAGNGVFGGIIIGGGNAAAKAYAAKYGYNYLSLHTHAPVLHEGISPTCTEAGTKAYYSCECGKYFEDEKCVLEIEDLEAWCVIPANGHAFNSADINWGDYKTASATLICDTDPTHTKVVEGLPVTQKVSEDPTCTGLGVMEYIVTVEFSNGVLCSYSLFMNTPALGHSWTTESLTWDGFKSAEIVCVCENDPAHTESAKGLISNVLKQEPTCTETGTRLYTATFTLKDGTVITAQKEETVAALGHDYGDVTFTWDGMEKASASRVCKHDASHTETAAAKITSEITSDPTCTEDGIRTYTASVTFADGTAASDAKEEALPALEHDWGEITFTWISAEEVYASRVCKRDDSHTETVSAEVSDRMTALPTCTECGEMTYTATAVFEDGTTATDAVTELLAPYGHYWGEPVFTWDGFTATASRVCGNFSDHIEKVEAEITITVKEEPNIGMTGVRLYTAKAVFEDGTVATDTREEEIPALTTMTTTVTTTTSLTTVTTTRVTTVVTEPATTAPITTVTVSATTTTAPITTVTVPATTTTAPITTVTVPATTTTAPITTVTVPATTTTAPITTMTIAATTTTAPITTVTVPATTITAPITTVTVSATTTTAPITTVTVPATTTTAPITTMTEPATTTTAPITTVTVPATTTTAPITTMTELATTTTAPVTSATTETTTRPTAPPAMKGDLDGSGTLSVADAVLVTRWLAEDCDLPIDALYIENADWDGDGMITMLDLAAQIEALIAQQ